MSEKTYTCLRVAASAKAGRQPQFVSGLKECPEQPKDGAIDCEGCLYLKNI